MLMSLHQIFTSRNDLETFGVLFAEKVYLLEKNLLVLSKWNA